jgi:hypothetical protein
MVYINECIDVNTALKNSFKSMSCLGRINQFQVISNAGKPQVVSRYILSSLCSEQQILLIVIAAEKVTQFKMTMESIYDFKNFSFNAILSNPYRLKQEQALSLYFLIALFTF